MHESAKFADKLGLSLGCSPPIALATGNWGAGAFLGDAHLKALIQWAAASEADLDMCYFPFDDAGLCERLGAITSAAVAREMTVGDLCTWLLGGGMLAETRENARGGRDVLEAFVVGNALQTLMH